jgi:DNA-binding NarL/FixJ family response regulator
MEPAIALLTMRFLAPAQLTRPGRADTVKKVVIIEDHKILREGLKSMLSGNLLMQVVGEAGEGVEAIQCVQTLNPDLVLLDLSMPKMNGIAVLKEIKSNTPQVKILLLTMHESEEHILEGFKAGADGYCLKDVGRTELLAAMQSVLEGKRYLSPGISGKVLEGYIDDRRVLKTVSSFERLTSREIEILKLIGEGFKNHEIAEHLDISIKTVEKHRSNLMEKLDLHNSSALTAYAIQKGLVTKVPVPRGEPGSTT